MWWIIGIVVYIVIASFTYSLYTSKKDYPKWEQVMIALSWICVLPVYGMRKLYDLISKLIGQ